MLPIETLHWTDELPSGKSPLSKLLLKLRSEPPRSAEALVFHSVFQKKSELDFFAKKKRNFLQFIRPLTKRRRPIQPTFPKDPRKLYLFFSGENTEVLMDRTDYALSFAFEYEVNHPYYRRLPLYALDGNLFGLTADTRNELLSTLPEKSAFCEFVYSHSVRRRDQLCQTVSGYKQVTCPGKALNNAPSIDSALGLSPAQSRQQANWLQTRQNYAQRFKFSIACENECYPGYTTEKIITAFRAGSIPIYYGDPLISEQFNPESFLDANRLSPSRLLSKIRELDNDPHAYQAMQQAPPIIHESTNSLFTKIPFFER